MKRAFIIFFILFINAPSLQAGKVKKTEDSVNYLDIVFCLDLSGSTNGLITDVREGLWHIVNQVSLLQPQPKFRIGVVGFSRPSFKKENAYVKVICPLTADFDFLSHELYKIKPAVEKGDQYVGVALKTCITKMKWVESKDAKKIIYIAGNGAVGTNNNDYLKACQLASERGILINAVYVMGKSDKARELPGWYKIASLTKGAITEIAVGRKDLPFSKEMDANAILETSIKFNNTYIYHGPGGYSKYQLFREADSASFVASPNVFAERVYYKKSSLFLWGNQQWELVDYMRLNGMLPEVLDAMFLPDSLRKKSAEEIYNIVYQAKTTRQQVISKLDVLYKDNYPLKVHKQYDSGELKEENSFARSVIILLLKEWN